MAGDVVQVHDGQGAAGPGIRSGVDEHDQCGLLLGRDERGNLGRVESVVGPVVDDQRRQRVVVHVYPVRVQVRADPAVLVDAAQLVEQRAPAVLVVEGGTDQQGGVGGGQSGVGAARWCRRCGEGGPAAVSLVRAIDVHVTNQVVERERGFQQAGQDLAEPVRRDADAAPGCYHQVHQQRPFTAVHQRRVGQDGHRRTAVGVRDERRYVPAMQAVPSAALHQPQPHPTVRESEHIVLAMTPDLVEQFTPQCGAVLVARADQQHVTGGRLGECGKGHDSPSGAGAEDSTLGHLFRILLGGILRRPHPVRLRHAAPGEGPDSGLDSSFLRGSWTSLPVRGGQRVASSASGGVPVIVGR